MKKLFAFIAVCLPMVMLSSLSVFSSCSGDDGKDKSIALLLPNGDINPKWVKDAEYITKAISAYGYTVETYMADDSEEGAKEQVRQLERVLKDGVRTVILTSIDYDAINESKVLDKYPDINLISYDRMLMNNPHVDIFVGCNPSDIGKMQAHYILERFKSMGGSPKKLEVIAGPSRDINAVKFYEGAFSLLESYYAGGKLTAPSGKVAYDEVSVRTWDTEDIKAEMAARLQNSGQVPDFVFCPNDNASDGVIQALKEYGCDLGNFPVVTGLDNVGVSRQYILDGYQSMSIDKSLLSIADNVGVVVNGFMCNSPVKTTSVFDNGTGDIPALYSNFAIVTKDDLLLGKK